MSSKQRHSTTNETTGGQLQETRTANRRKLVSNYSLGDGDQDESWTGTNSQAIESLSLEHCCSNKCYLRRIRDRSRRGVVDESFFLDFGLKQELTWQTIVSRKFRRSFVKDLCDEYYS